MKIYAFFKDIAPSKGLRYYISCDGESMKMRFLGKTVSLVKVLTPES